MRWEYTLQGTPANYGPSCTGLRSRNNNYSPITCALIHTHGQFSAASSPSSMSLEGACYTQRTRTETL